MKKVLCIIVMAGLTIAFGAKNSFSGDGDVKQGNVLIKGANKVPETKISVHTQGEDIIDPSEVSTANGEEDTFYVDESVREAFSGIGEEVLDSFAKCLGECLEEYESCPTAVAVLCVKKCSGDEDVDVCGGMIPRFPARG